jgi:hypothetical protein
LDCPILVSWYDQNEKIIQHIEFNQEDFTEQEDYSCSYTWQYNTKLRDRLIRKTIAVPNASCQIKIKKRNSEWDAICRNLDEKFHTNLKLETGGNGSVDLSDEFIEDEAKRRRKR